MTAVLPATAVPTDAVPAPRVAPEPVRPVRRMRPPSQYWDVTEARWRAAR